MYTTHSPCTFTKLQPQKKHFTALSFEWLNNSRKYDSSSSSCGFCLWSEMTHGRDALKPLLWIRLCALKRMAESGSVWQMVSLNGGPKHLRDVAKSVSQWRWIAKNRPERILVKVLKLYFLFRRSAHLTIWLSWSYRDTPQPVTQDCSDC